MFLLIVVELFVFMLLYISYHHGPRPHKKGLLNFLLFFLALFASRLDWNCPREHAVEDTFVSDNLGKFVITRNMQKIHRRKKSFQLTDWTGWDGLGCPLVATYADCRTGVGVWLVGWLTSWACCLVGWLWPVAGERPGTTNLRGLLFGTIFPGLLSFICRSFWKAFFKGLLMGLLMGLLIFRWFLLGFHYKTRTGLLILTGFYGTANLNLRAC